MDLLQLGALSLALLAVLTLIGTAWRGVRWLLKTAQRLEEVLERTDLMPKVAADVEQLQLDVAALTGQVAGVAAQAHGSAMVAGQHSTLLARLKADLDTLWTRHRVVVADVAALKAARP